MNASLSFNRLPTPPPPDHPPLLPMLEECPIEAVPNTSSAPSENCDSYTPEVSNQRKNSALRWADLDPDSEGSGDESQQGVGLTTPLSAASTGAPASCATDSPARSQ